MQLELLNYKTGDVTKLCDVNSFDHAYKELLDAENSPLLIEDSELIPVLITNNGELWGFVMESWEHIESYDALID